MRVGSLDNYYPGKGDNKNVYYFMAIAGGLFLGIILMFLSRIFGGIFKALFKYWYVIPITILLIILIRRKKKK